MMLRRLLRNRKGTAEVIGSVMFIIILLFFFTNVYLWHDAATKDVNQFNLKQINSTFKIEQTNGVINITANGGSAITLARLWIVEDGVNGKHLFADLGAVNVAAGEFCSITFAGYNSPSNPTDHVNAARQLDGSILVYYESGHGTCTVINTLGVAESTAFQTS
jgi:hypothetical protein